MLRGCGYHEFSSQILRTKEINQVLIISPIHFASLYVSVKVSFPSVYCFSQFDFMNSCSSSMVHYSSDKFIKPWHNLTKAFAAKALLSCDDKTCQVTSDSGDNLCE